MRELKFRAFNKKEKKMCKVVSTDFKQMLTIRFPEFDGLIGDFDDQMELIEFEPLMQYTGLKDYHGNEIYEGDILFRQRTHRNKNGTKGKVEFKNSTWMLIDEEGASPLSDFVFNTEILGNIFEHPHLLEVSTE